MNNSKSENESIYLFLILNPSFIMKTHFLFLLSFSLFATPLAYASTDTQAAVNIHGVCREFSSQAIVPTGWKHVPSCDLIKPKTGARIDDVQSRRNESHWAKLRAKMKAQKTETETTDRRAYQIGRGAYTKDTSEYQYRLNTRELKSQDRTPRRTFTMPNYTNTRAQKWAQERSNKAGYEINKTHTKKTNTTNKRYMINGRLRPGIQSGTEMNRSGYLRTLPNQSGIRKVSTPNWNNKSSVETFWKPLETNKKEKADRLELIRKRLDGRRALRFTTERQFGSDAIE